MKGWENKSHFRHFILLLFSIHPEESKYKSGSNIRVIDDKITELLENPDIIKEKKDDESVDKGGADMVKEFYEKW